MYTLRTFFKTWCLPFAIAFVFSVLFLLLTNALFLGSFHGCVGRAKFSVLACIVLTIFCLIYRKDKRDLGLGLITWGIFMTPIVMSINLNPELQLTIKSIRRLITEGNTWAITSSILLISITTLSSLYRNKSITFVLKVTSAICWFTFLLLPFSYICYWIINDTLLTSDTIIAILQTNPDEAIEFLTFKGYDAILTITIAFLFLIAFSLYSIKNKTREQFNKRYSPFFSIIVSILLACLISYNTVNNIITFPYLQAITKIERLIAFDKAILQRQSILNQLNQLKENGNNGLYVFVIGESHNRNRSSAYGYTKPTTPWLNQQKNQPNFILLKNAYSCYAGTVPALSNALTSLHQYKKESLANSPSIVELVVASDYETYWISNQNPLGAFDTPITIIANSAHNKIWLNKIVGENLISNYFDDEIIKNLPAPSSKEKNIIFIHLLGSHNNYVERYPRNFNKWNDNNKPNGNAYDNSILFNDYVLQNIYQKVSQHKNFQAMIYMSDHGENVGYGHAAEAFTWDMVQIPIWFAFSKDYMTNHQNVVAALKQNANKPFTNDMMFDTFCGILGLTSHPYYEPKNDLSAVTYDRPLSELTTLFGEKKIADDPALRQ